MKKRSLLLGLLVLTLGFVLVGCGDDDSDTPAGGNNGGNETVENGNGYETNGNGDETNGNGDETIEVGLPDCVGEGDPISIVLYPNESGSEFSAVHDDLRTLICLATGRPGDVQLTIDYNIAIEAIANGTADLAFMGPTGYIIASNQNPNVRAMFVSSGPSGTLEDAVYYSFLAVREEDAHLWEAGDGGFDLNLLEGESMSFVALTSTSGFVVPSIGLNSLGFLPEGVAPEDHFGIGGPFFSEVLMGVNHQGSAFNLLTGQTNVAAFFNMESVFEIYDDFGGTLTNQAGMIYAVRQDAEAPLDSVAGELMRIILSISVPNAPFVANFDTLTDAEVEAIVEVFTSELVTDNENFWASDDTTIAFQGLRHGEERFLTIPDDFFDDLR